MSPLRLLLYLLVLALLAGGFLAVKHPELLAGPVAPPDPAEFQELALSAANERRGKVGIKPLAQEAKLQDLLREFVDSGRLDALQLNGVFAYVQREDPQLHEVSANLIYAGRQDQLEAQLETWAELGGGQFSHFATYVFPAPEPNRGIGCLALVAQRLPDLALPLNPSARDQSTYFSHCRICKHGHGVNFGKAKSSTLIVSCPNCEKAYDLIAADTHGMWRRANTYFTGMDSPVVRGWMTDMQRVMAVWQDVVTKCRYQLDAERILGGDSWEKPEDTYNSGIGDCEDTSLLLADMLMSQGFQAKVALGRHNGEGHAWVVVQVEGEDYLLETTWNDVGDLDQPPLLEEVGIDYEPQYLIDRDSIYFRRHYGWTGDYWTDRNWTQVIYPLDEADAGESTTEVAALSGKH